MKNYTLVILLLIGFTQCKKEETPQVQTPILTPLNDYRDSFCGDFSFTTITGWETISNTSSADTSTFQSTVSKVANSDSLVVIHYKSGTNLHSCGDFDWGANIEVLLRPNGDLVNIKSSECPHTIMVGNYFQSDSIYTSITRYAQGGRDFDKISGVRE